MIRQIGICCTFFLMSFIFTNDTKTYLVRSIWEPNNVYKMKVIVDGVTELKYSGDPYALQSLAKGGVPDSIDGTSKSTIGETVTTGPLQSDSSFSIVLKIDDYMRTMNMNGITKDSTTSSPFAGVTMNGRCAKDGSIEDIKIEGRNLDEQLKNVFPSMLKNMNNSIKYPKGPIAIGDSFQQKMNIPFSVPGVKPFNLNFTNNMKLVGVDADTAFLHNNFVITFTLRDTNYTADIVGSGTGTVKHDLRLNHIFDYVTDTQMSFKIETGKVGMVGKVIARSELHSQITGLH